MTASTSVMDLGMVGNDDTETLLDPEGIPGNDTAKRRRRAGVERDPRETLNSASLWERRTGGGKEGSVLSLGRRMNPPGSIPEDNGRRDISARGEAAGNALRENPFSSLSFQSSEEKEFGPITVTLQRPEMDPPRKMDQLELPMVADAQSSSGGSVSSTQILLKPPDSQPEAPRSSYLDASRPLSRCMSAPNSAELHERLTELKREQEDDELSQVPVKRAGSTMTPERRTANSGGAKLHNSRRFKLAEKSSASMPGTPPGYHPNPTCASRCSTPDRMASVKSYEFGHMLGSQGIIMVDPPPTSSSASERAGLSPLPLDLEQSRPPVHGAERERRHDSDDADTESTASAKRPSGVTVRLSSYFNRSTRASIKSVISGNQTLGSDMEKGKQTEQPAPPGLMQEYIRGYAAQEAVNPLLKAAQKKPSQPASTEERNRRLAQLNRLQSIELDKLSYESQQDAESEAWRHGMQQRVEHRGQHRCRDRHRTIAIVVIAVLVLVCLVAIPPLATTKWKSNGDNDDTEDMYNMAMPDGGSCPGKSYRGSCFVLINGLPEPWLIAHQVCYRLGGEMAMLSQRIEKEDSRYVSALCGLVAETSELEGWWIDEKMFMGQDLDGGDLNLVNSPAGWNTWWGPDGKGVGDISNVKCRSISRNGNVSDAYTMDIAGQTVYIAEQDCRSRLPVICRF